MATRIMVTLIMATLTLPTLLTYQGGRAQARARHAQPVGTPVRRALPPLGPLKTLTLALALTQTLTPNP